MRLEFQKNTGKPVKMVARAEVFFDADDIFHGLKLTGFSIWKGDKGLFVSLPAREYDSKDGKKYWDFLSNADPHDKKSTWKLKDHILSEYKKFVGEPEEEPEEEEVPF
jgi:DNA-binding cell septation regulator SpoVG